MSKRKHPDNSSKFPRNKKKSRINQAFNLPNGVLQCILLPLCDLETQHALCEVISGSNEHGRFSLIMDKLAVYSPQQLIRHPEQITHLSMNCDIRMDWKLFTSLTHLEYQFSAEIKNSSLKRLPQTLLSVVILACDNITKVGMRYLKTLDNLTHLSIGEVDNWSRQKVCTYFDNVKYISSSHYETNNCIVRYTDNYIENLYF